MNVHHILQAIRYVMLPVLLLLLQAAVLKNVDGVVSIVITLKSFYPKVDVGKLLQRTPKLLFKPVEQIQADAQQVYLSVLQSIVVSNHYM